LAARKWLWLNGMFSPASREDGFAIVKMFAPAA
jgi:hypothetical protein